MKDENEPEEIVTTLRRRISEKPKNTDDDEVPVHIDLPDEEFEYNLVGVIIHMGTAKGGHYFSYINVESEEDKQKYLKFNDSDVSNFPLNQKIAETCFGGKLSEEEVKRI